MRWGEGKARALLLAMLLCCLGTGTGRGEEDAGPAAPEEPRQSGRDIYARVLENRFRSVIQESTLRSADRGGRQQITKLRMHWKDFRDENDRPTRGVLSKTLVQYSHPFDIRHAGYLVVQRDSRASDQFVYFPSRRRVVRVSLRSG